MDVAGIVPPVLHAALARIAFTPRLFNVTITNVPGPQTTLYALGAPMRRVIPLVPIFADHAVGFAVVSYDGEVVFGLNGDHGAMADLDVLGEGLERSLDELREIVGLPPARRAAAAHGGPPVTIVWFVVWLIANNHRRQRAAACRPGEHVDGDSYLGRRARPRPGGRGAAAWLRSPPYE